MDQSKRVLILGGAGMLGHRLWLSFKDQFETTITLRQPIINYERFKIFDRAHTLDNIDVSNLKNLEYCFEKIKPHVVINSIGIIKQLKEAKDPIPSIKTNALFPHELAKMAERFQSKLIHISTDCVFSGAKGNYSEDDFADAKDLYGCTKYLGEASTSSALTIRTSIIGRGLTSQVSLVDWLLSQPSRTTVKGYTNAIFTGFPTNNLAQIFAWLIQDHPQLSGLYHLASPPITKYDLLKKLQKAFHLDIEITPFDDFHCDRSLNGSRFNKATGFIPPSWDEMIEGLAKENSFYQELKNVAGR